jgi:cadmium carbonic anhydrase-like repeat protein
MGNAMKHSLEFLQSTTAILLVLSGAAVAREEAHETVSDEIIAEQREILAEKTKGKGYGPQSPRDIDLIAGNNSRSFKAAPDFSEMSLCNIHFHESAEHKGGEFTKYVGNGDGEGFGGGYAYSGELRAAELADTGVEIGSGENGDLAPGDTIEVHYVYSTAQVTPGPTLGACLSDTIKNPQLRVETQVYVLVNDNSALNFVKLNEVSQLNGLFQAKNMPSNTGEPVQYAGSTTGPGYNEKGSPFQVTWSIRPQIAKVNVLTVGQWLDDNVFEETFAHGVRNLVVNPDLLSTISR